MRLMSRFSIVSSAAFSRPVRCSSVMNSLRFLRNTASNGGQLSANTRPEISSVVKCALSKMTPLPACVARSRCSNPSSRVIARCRRSLSQRPRPISITDMPSASKCRFASASRSAVDNSGKHNSMLRRTMARRVPAKRCASLPMPRPTANVHRCGNRQIRRSIPTASHSGQFRGVQK